MSTHSNAVCHATNRAPRKGADHGADTAVRERNAFSGQFQELDIQLRPAALPLRAANHTHVWFESVHLHTLAGSLWGMDSWTKATREKYMAALGLGGGLGSLRPPAPKAKPADFGHCADGAAHLGNLAFRCGSRACWDYAGNRVTLVKGS